MLRVPAYSAAFISCVLATVAAVTWAPDRADAYLLPVSHIVRKANARLAQIRTLQVALVGRVRIEGRDPPVSLGERWIFGRAAGSAVVDSHIGDGRRAKWTRGKGVEGNALAAPSSAERLVLTRLFADGDIGALAGDIGADIERQSLTMHRRRIAHVIGAGPGETTLPQIWIDQDDFAVVRVRLRLERTGLVDIEFDDWDGPPVNGLFPHRMRTAVDGRWTRIVYVETVRANSAGGAARP